MKNYKKKKEFCTPLNDATVSLSLTKIFFNSTSLKNKKKNHFNIQIALEKAFRADVKILFTIRIELV